MSSFTNLTSDATCYLIRFVKGEFVILVEHFSQILDVKN